MFASLTSKAVSLTSKAASKVQNAAKAVKNKTGTMAITAKQVVTQQPMQYNQSKLYVNPETKMNTSSDYGRVRKRYKDIFDLLLDIEKLKINKPNNITISDKKQQLNKLELEQQNYDNTNKYDSNGLRDEEIKRLTKLIVESEDDIFNNIAMGQLEKLRKINIEKRFTSKYEDIFNLLVMIKNIKENFPVNNNKLNSKLQTLEKLESEQNEYDTINPENAKKMLAIEIQRLKELINRPTNSKYDTIALEQLEKLQAIQNKPMGGSIRKRRTRRKKSRRYTSKRR